MHSTQNYNRYSDALTLKRKRLVIKRLILSISIILALVATTGYFIFFTDYLLINEISINGLRTISSEEIASLINAQKNIIFFDTAIARDKILAQFTVVKSAEIKKQYPHKITVNLTERIPIGTWCFRDSCHYFDEEGVLWGQALKSSGSLLLTVGDNNESISKPTKIELTLIENIKKIVAGFDTIGLGIKGIEIPIGSINDIKINTTKEYYVLADTSSDIDKQLDILRIFLKNKGEELHPAYIDIRIEGRVYYK